MRVRRDSRYSLTEAGDLIIDGFDESDHGDYECQLETDTDHAIFIRHSLKEAVAPSVRLEPVSGQVVMEEVSGDLSVRCWGSWCQNENTTLRCHVTGQPSPRLTWSTPGASHVSRRAELHMVGVSRAQAGQYSCCADNGVGAPACARLDLSVECTYWLPSHSSLSILILQTGRRWSLQTWQSTPGWASSSFSPARCRPGPGPRWSGASSTGRSGTVPGWPPGSGETLTTSLCTTSPTQTSGSTHVKLGTGWESANRASLWLVSDIILLEWWGLKFVCRFPFSPHRERCCESRTGGRTQSLLDYKELHSSHTAQNSYQRRKTDFLCLWLSWDYRHWRERQVRPLTSHCTCSTPPTVEPQPAGKYWLFPLRRHSHTANTSTTCWATWRKTPPSPSSSGGPTCWPCLPTNGFPRSRNELGWSKLSEEFQFDTYLDGKRPPF